MAACEETLVLALSVLRHGESLDHDNDVEGAIEMYTSAVSQLDAIIPNLPREQGESARRNAEEARRRIETLGSRRWLKEQATQFPAFPIMFEPALVPVEEYRCPSCKHMRVFWIMRLLHRSMHNGAFVTPNLYVPVEVWTQHAGASAILHVGAKTRYATALCRSMDALQSINYFSDWQKTRTALTTFLEEERKLREVLDQDMGKNADSKSAPKKTLWKVVTRTARMLRHNDGSLEIWLQRTSDALKRALTLERWMIYFNQEAQTSMLHPPVITEVMQLLARITGQLYNGMCLYLLQDVILLVKRYQEKCCKSVVRLFPLSVKLDGDDGDSKN